MASKRPRISTDEDDLFFRPPPLHPIDRAKRQKYDAHWSLGPPPSPTPSTSVSVRRRLFGPIADAMSQKKHLSHTSPTLNSLQKAPTPKTSPPPNRPPPICSKKLQLDTIATESVRSATKEYNRIAKAAERKREAEALKAWLAYIYTFALVVDSFAPEGTHSPTLPAAPIENEPPSSASESTVMVDPINTKVVQRTYDAPSAEVQANSNSMALERALIRLLRDEYYNAAPAKVSPEIRRFLAELIEIIGDFDTDTLGEDLLRWNITRSLLVRHRESIEGRKLIVRNANLMREEAMRTAEERLEVLLSRAKGQIACGLDVMNPS